MTNKKTSSKSKLINEIKMLKKQIESTLAKNKKKDIKREFEMQLFNKANELIQQKTDYINPRSRKSLNKSIVKAKSKRLTNIIYVLENINVLGNEKITTNKLKLIKSNIENQLEENKVIIGDKVIVFDGSVSDVVISYKSNSLYKFFQYTKKSITNYLTQRLHAKGNIKCNFIMKCVLVKSGEELEFLMTTLPHIVNNINDISDVIDSLFNDFSKRLDIIKLSSSGWIFSNTVSIESKTVKYIPLKANSYIELPKWISGKKCCVNVKNEDNECFKWSILSCLFNKEVNQDRLFKVNQYRKFVDKLIWDGIKFPTKIDDIHKFEKNNPTIAINVFIIDNDSKEKGENRICPYYSSKLYKDRTIINLLLIEDKQNNHYVWIKNFNRFMGHDNNHKFYYCTHCLQKYSTNEKLEEHKISCSIQDISKIEMPKEGSVTKFKNFYKMLKVPFVYYADFESYLVPVVGCDNDNNKSSTTVFQKH